MRLFRRTCGVGAAAVLCGGFALTARAADLPPVEAAPAYNWTGFYLGANAGDGFLETGYKRPFTTLANVSTGTIKPQPTYDLHAGFNYQAAQRLVIGLEANYTSFDGGKFNELNGNLDFLQSTRYVAALSGRAGFLASPSTMIYGKLGPAMIETRGYQGFGGTFQKMLNGFQAGLGIETLVTPNIALRAEGTYIQSLQTLSLNTGNDLNRPTFLQVAVGASYKFDAPQGWSAAGAGGSFAAEKKRGAPVWTGVELGGLVSLNGNAMRYLDHVLGSQGSYSDISPGGGGFVGINYQVNPNIVAGVEASGNWQNANFSTAAGVTSTGGGGGTFYRFSTVNGIFAVTGRAGWLATPDTLLYFKVGPAWIEARTLANYFTAIVTPNPTGNHYLRGYQFGLGAETFVTSNISVRIEGLYTHSSDMIAEQSTTPVQFFLQPSSLSATAGAALHF